ncbi:MAG: amino acid adenylation domain-containing protein, partial [Myxococcales bacterium]|nr:amino acid adenylation domain-containing protein [Myxococcales bacterium]
RLSELDYLTAVERRELLEDWSVGPSKGLLSRLDAPVTSLFEAQVAKTPQAPAVTFLDGPTWTYRELNERANAFARWFGQHGVERGDRVAILAESSLDRLAAIVGTLKAGAAYVPVSPSGPPARIQEILADCQAKMVWTGQFEPSSPADKDLSTGLSTELSPDDLAYIIYTSGSTGRPKGVAVSHRSLWHLVESQLKAFHIDASSRVLQFASLDFDASVSEIFTALLSGARLYLAPRRVLVPSHELMTLLKRWSITTVTFPPSVLSQLQHAELPALRTLIVAGEPCPAELVTRWAPGRRFLNAYGPTEVTVCATVAEVQSDGRKPPIGRAIGDARVYVLDASRRPVAIGVTGELYVAGPGVARGYWNRNDLTSASFMEDGLGAGRMYRTGDLARFLPNGELDFVGRGDHQVKLRGFRVELGEVESALRRDGGLISAAVVVDGDRLAACIVPKDTPKYEWWPSIAEYFVYDDLAYHAMSSDERRNDSYRGALAQCVPGKVVVEVGTGPEVLLSRLCIEAGARKAYAIELMPESYKKAVARVEELGLGDRIEVLLGDATQITLPEAPDVCVSEIVGAIGGSEGAAAILNAMRQNLAGNQEFIPLRSTTMYAPVQLPAELLGNLAFGPLAARYVEKIFAQVGNPFDLRVCVKGLDHSHLLGAPQVFEDLDFRVFTEPETRHRAVHRIARHGRLDGFLVWLTLDTGYGSPIDILEHEHCWLPVFLPAFDSLDVQEGDSIEAVAGALLSQTKHPAYFVEGTLRRQAHGTLPFRYDSPRHGRAFRASPFYRRLFSDSRVPRIEPFDEATLSHQLRQYLPEYMIPDTFVRLEELPLLPSGKLDRRKLASQVRRHRSLARDSLTAPRSRVERSIAHIWKDVLQLPRVGIQTNFFEQGGHSLLLLRVQDRVQEELGITVSVTDLFNYPTVEALAQRLTTPTLASHDDPDSRATARRQALAQMAARRNDTP